MEAVTIEYRTGDKLLIEMEKELDNSTLQLLTRNVNLFLNNPDQGCLIVPAGMVKQIIVLQKDMVSIEDARFVKRQNSDGVEETSVEIMPRRLLRFEEGA